MVTWKNMDTLASWKALEQVERIMGIGAESVATVPSGKGLVCVGKYKDGRYKELPELVSEVGA